MQERKHLVIGLEFVKVKVVVSLARPGGVLSVGSRLLFDGTKVHRHSGGAKIKNQSL